MGIWDRGKTISVGSHCLQTRPSLKLTLAVVLLLLFAFLVVFYIFREAGECLSFRRQPLSPCLQTGFNSASSGADEKLERGFVGRGGKV
jgi:hypothetical protein